jgi:hypothetical protein
VGTYFTPCPSLGFVVCFEKVLQEFVSVQMKDPIEKKGLVVLNDLISAINDREDAKKRGKWEMIGV